MNEELNFKKKPQKPEEFIGRTFNDGKLKVVGIHGKGSGYTAMFRIECEICSKDKELFPLGYFVSSKSDLVKGQIPCGCSRRPRWNKDQWIIRASRVGKQKGFDVVGYVDEFTDCTTKIRCRCIHDGCEWSPRLDNIVNNNHGCPECGQNKKKKEFLLPQEKVVDKCTDMCTTFGYEFQGFLDGKYIGAAKTTVLYKCPVHGNRQISYRSFVDNGHGCIECWKERQKSMFGGFYGLYLDRLKEQDLLYVLSFNNGDFIKVGRTFNLADRLTKLKSKRESSNKNIIVIRMFSGCHEDIWNLEQELHNKLKRFGFKFSHSSWRSNELFKTESLPLLSIILDNCGFEEVFN